MELPCWREFSISEIEEFKKICLGKYPTFINLTHLEDEQWAKIAEQLQAELKNVKTILPFPLAIVTGERSKNFHFPKALCVQKINELPNQYFYRTKSFGLDQKNKSDQLSVLCDLLAEKTETTSFFDHMREINSYRSENLELHRILFGKD